MTYIIILLLGSAGLVIAATIRPLLIYQYPYFMGATFLAFIGPQAYALYTLNIGTAAVETMLVMSCLCLAACWFGYTLQPHPGIISRLNVPINANRYLQAGLLFVAVGFVCNHLIERLPEEAKGTMWSGIVTIYAFFGQLIYPGFAICLHFALRRRNVLAWIAVSFAAIIPLELTIFYARREATVLFLLTLGLSLYFLKGKLAPRWLVLSAVIGAIFLIPVTGDYRRYADEGPIQALKQLDLLQGLNYYMDPEAVSEVKNATILIAATQQSGDYGFGAEYWNQIVFRFVPAQFVGEGFKKWLMIGGEQRDWNEFVSQSVSFDLPRGATITGIADSFNQFWYFGCLAFAAIGYLFKNLWSAAIQPSGTMSQILYIQVATSAMKALTHQTVDFLPGFLYGLIFIGFVAIYAKERGAACDRAPAAFAGFGAYQPTKR